MRRRKFLKFAAFSRRHRETFSGSGALFLHSPVSDFIEDLVLTGNTEALTEGASSFNPAQFSPVSVRVANTDCFFGGDVLRRAFAAIPSGVTYSEAGGALTYTVTENATLLSADDFTLSEDHTHRAVFRFRGTDPDGEGIATGIVLKISGEPSVLLTAYAATDTTGELVAEYTFEEGEILTGIDLCPTEGSLTLLPDGCRVGAILHGDSALPHVPFSESVTVPVESLPYGIPDEEGGVYDTLSLTRGTLTRRIACVKLSGLRFTLVEKPASFSVFYATLPEPADPDRPIALCKGYRPRADYASLSTNSYSALLSADGRGVFVTVLTSTTSANFQTAFNRRDSYFYYPLRTPKTEQVTPLPVGSGCGCSATVSTETGYNLTALCRV